MNEPCVLLSLAAVAALATVPPPQNVPSLRPMGPNSRFFEDCVPSPARGAVGLPVRFAYPSPMRTAVAAPLGAVCVDDRAGLIFLTDGNGVIHRVPYPHIGDNSAIPPRDSNSTTTAHTPRQHRFTAAEHASRG